MRIALELSILRQQGFCTYPKKKNKKIEKVEKAIDTISVEILAPSPIAQKFKTIAIERIADYGPILISEIGFDVLKSLPYIPAKKLNLEGVDVYPNCRVKPEMMQHGAVLTTTVGEMYDKSLCFYPAIVIKLEILDPTSKKVIDTVAEVIQKRYPLEADGGKGQSQENNYVTATKNLYASGKTSFSSLYASGGMSLKDFAVVKQLLAGEEVISRYTRLLIRMSKG